MGKDSIYLGRLQDYYASHRLIPSYANIGKLLSLNSKASVAALVGRLKRQGYLDSHAGRTVPTDKFFARPLVGTAPAGFASPASDLLNDAISIDEYLVEHPASTVLVQVKGDSMIGAGIHDGDILVVERNGAPPVGKMVVAVVDGEYTVKYLKRDGKGFYLQPANAHYPPLRPQGELQVFGVVVGAFRKL